MRGGPPGPPASRKGRRWPMEVPHMYRFRAPTAVAVTVLLLVGCQSGASSSSEPGSEPPASVAPSEAAPSAAADRSLPEGPFLWFDPAAPLDPQDDGPPITVTIPASGWTFTDSSILWKGDEVDNLRSQRFSGPPPRMASWSTGIPVTGKTPRRTPRPPRPMRSSRPWRPSRRGMPRTRWTYDRRVRRASGHPPRAG